MNPVLLEYEIRFTSSVQLCTLSLEIWTVCSRRKPLVHVEIIWLKLCLCYHRHYVRSLFLIGDSWRIFKVPHMLRCVTASPSTTVSLKRSSSKDEPLIGSLLRGIVLNRRCVFADLDARRGSLATRAASVTLGRVNCLSLDFYYHDLRGAQLGLQANTHMHVQTLTHTPHRHQHTWPSVITHQPSGESVWESVRGRNGSPVAGWTAWQQIRIQRDQSDTYAVLLSFLLLICLYRPLLEKPDCLFVSVWQSHLSGDEETNDIRYSNLSQFTAVSFSIGWTSFGWWDFGPFVGLLQLALQNSGNFPWKLTWIYGNKSGIH